MNTGPVRPNGGVRPALSAPVESVPPEIPAAPVAETGLPAASAALDAVTGQPTDHSRIRSGPGERTGNATAAVYETTPGQRRMPTRDERVMGVSSAIFSHRGPNGDGFGMGTYGSAVSWLDFLVQGKQNAWLMMPTLPTGDDPSPYVPRSSIGSNTLLIDMRQVPDYEAGGGLEALESRLPQRDVVRDLARAESADRIPYDLCLPLKTEALRVAFEHFHENEWLKGTPAAAELKAFQSEEKEWLHDFARFEAVSKANGGAPHWKWPAALARREPAALEQADQDLAKEMLFVEYGQFHAQRQQETLFREAEKRGVLLIADKPAGVHENSVDVWRFPRLFCRTEADHHEGGNPNALMRLGVNNDLGPGEDWPIPYTNYPEMAKDDYAWLRTQVSKMKRTCHIIRWDHAVAPFRQFIRQSVQSAGGPYVQGRFFPAEEAEQDRQGREIYSVALEEAGRIIPEDLGAVPDFARQALVDLGIGGMAVVRWQKDWKAEGQPYLKPDAYLPTHTVVTATHDTSTLKGFFERENGPAEVAAQAASFGALQGFASTSEFTPELQQAQLEAYADTPARLFIVYEEDVWGTDEGMNVPGTVGDSNWTYVSPEDPVTWANAAGRLAQVAERSGRVVDPDAPTAKA